MKISEKRQYLKEVFQTQYRVDSGLPFYKWVNYYDPSEKIWKIFERSEQSLLGRYNEAKIRDEVLASDFILAVNLLYKLVKAKE